MTVYEHFIKDPVHGYIGITDIEKCVLDTSPMQRLRRILQLPTSTYVYPGATHTRFSHSIGSMYIAGVMTSHILDRALPGRERPRELLTQFMRLVLLLHDIGHGPYSHTFEEAVLYPIGSNHEYMGAEIVYRHPEISECIERHGKDLSFTREDLAEALRSRSPSEWPVIGVEGVDETIERSLYYVMKGSFSADILDYLIRDSYYTGAGYGSGVDWARIAYNIVPVRGGLAINEKAIDAFEHLIIARYHMFMSVYYHKTSRAIDLMVSRVLREASRSGVLDVFVRDPIKYTELDDYTILAIPEIRGSELVRDLLRRRIRFAAIDEYRVPIHRSIQVLAGALDRDYLNKILWERLPEDLRERVFIDTPVLPLNPMFQGEDLLIQRGDGTIYVRRFDETSLGLLSQSVVVLRLYIDRDLVDRRGEALRVFREVLRAGGIRSFF